MKTSRKGQDKPPDRKIEAGSSQSDKCRWLENTNILQPHSSKKVSAGELGREDGVGWSVRTWPRSRRGWRAAWHSQHCVHSCGPESPPGSVSLKTLARCAQRCPHLFTAALLLKAKKWRAPVCGELAMVNRGRPVLWNALVIKKGKTGCTDRAGNS